MRRSLGVIVLALLFGVGASQTIAQPNAAAPAALSVARTDSTMVTSTVWLPLIARSQPSQPYVLKVIQLPAGNHPHGLALDVDHQRAFVGNYWANTLSVIDTAAMTLSATIPLPNATGPNGVAYHAGLDRVYVANRDSNNLSIIDPTQGTVADTKNVGYLPNGVAVLGNLVYVANFGANSISILDATLNQVTRTLSLGSEPSQLTVLDEYATVYVSSHGNNRVYLLKDAAYYNTTDILPAPYGLTIDPITYRLYVANRGAAHTVTLVDVNPNWLMGTIGTGCEPYVLAINPRTGHLFVACGDVINVYDRRDNALIATIPIGLGATEGIAVDPARNLIYVTSSDVDQLTVIQDIPTVDLAYVTYRLSANQQPQSDVLITDDAGRHVSQLTHAVGDLELNVQPTFQPNGKRLAFVSSRDEADHNWNVFTMDLMGYNQVDLTNDGGIEDTEPAWSPDGTQIAWRRDWSIWVMNANGSNKRQLTSGLSARTPQWSPDGQWLCFLAWPPGEMYYMDVYLVPANGGPIIDVTNDPKNDLQPSWSPDSREIAFETDRHSTFTGTQVITANWEIYRVNISTKVQTRLTDDAAQDHAAAWSPDGAQIAWLSDRGAAQYDYQVWVMAPDGSQPRRLTNGQQWMSPIRWSPDSRRLAVQAGLLSDANLALIDVASGAQQMLANTPLEEALPAWRPDTWR